MERLERDNTDLVPHFVLQGGAISRFPGASSPLSPSHFCLKLDLWVEHTFWFSVAKFFFAFKSLFSTKSS